MWECPILVAPPCEDKQNRSVDSGFLEGSFAPAGVAPSRGKDHVLLISPDAPINPVQFWIGRCLEHKFLLEEAEGPQRLANETC